MEESQKKNAALCKSQPSPPKIDPNAEVSRFHQMVLDQLHCPVAPLVVSPFRSRTSQPRSRRCWSGWQIDRRQETLRGSLTLMAGNPSEAVRISGIITDEFATSTAVHSSVVTEITCVLGPTSVGGLHSRRRSGTGNIDAISVTETGVEPRGAARRTLRHDTSSRARLHSSEFDGGVRVIVVGHAEICGKNCCVGWGV